MARILFFLFALVAIISMSCNVNRPRKAADDYCECLRKEFVSSVDTESAFVHCDSMIAMKYEELYAYYSQVNVTALKGNWDSVSKFYSNFSNFRQKDCCNLIGNCDTFDFADSIEHTFTTYFRKNSIKQLDFIKFLLDSCVRGNDAYKYGIRTNDKIVSLIEDRDIESTFYYEIVEFEDSVELNSLIYLIEHSNCLVRRSSRVRSYKRIDKTTIFLCNYDHFDFEKMKKLIVKTFRGGPIVTIW
jgi:hypothetical protein